VIRFRLASTFVVLVAAWPAAARAQQPGPSPGPPAQAPLVPPGGDDVARAQALFDEAIALRDAGRFAEACPKFAESRRLAPGIGVTLHLAGCYETIGKTQSAWSEFRNAEKLARERDDKRAQVAAARAEALEPRLNRLTITATVAADKAPPEVLFDGVAMPPDALNATLVVDPGDHRVQVRAMGHAPRTLTVHVDPSVLSTTVTLDGTDGEAPALAAPATAPAPPASAPSPQADPGATRRWIGYGLMVPGAAGIAIGTWLLSAKVTWYMANGQPCDQKLRRDAVPGAVVAYAAGGLAIASGITLVLTAPKRTEVAIAPMALPGGGGAQMWTAF
jgi:hypothetical protein